MIGRGFSYPLHKRIIENCLSSAAWKKPQWKECHKVWHEHNVSGLKPTEAQAKGKAFVSGKAMMLLHTDDPNLELYQPLLIPLPVVQPGRHW
ncbi:hypothetical protein PILCRDRAFT_333679 [Piloderma croceum F 1598]|uniref:Uncharacterized protein n=1 Tax=Piloderma croceum (strain F 1598) TaxID=765440 RepID=A0A0C3FPP6_PILCF|nr:hypothetical protein PILCRDRAFT_333679 [Piloderma croceum F 1598]